jgi:hypothetical protein
MEVLTLMASSSNAYDIVGERVWGLAGLTGLTDRGGVDGAGCDMVG